MVGREKGPERAATGRRVGRASLCAGGWETAYARAGAGPPLLLLGDPDDALTRSLVSCLAPTRRVFAPEPPMAGGSEAPDAPDGGPPGFARWLRDFLDGVGIGEAPLVVSDPRLAAGALAFAASDPCRVSRLMLLFEGGAPDETDARALAGEVEALLAAERP
jgi:hypothetical protein